jgi:hypothetical protein
MSIAALIVGTLAALGGLALFGLRLTLLSSRQPENEQLQASAFLVRRLLLLIAVMFAGELLYLRLSTIHLTWFATGALVLLGLIGVITFTAWLASRSAPARGHRRGGHQDSRPTPGELPEWRHPQNPQPTVPRNVADSAGAGGRSRAVDHDDTGSPDSFAA